MTTVEEPELTAAAGPGVDALVLEAGSAVVLRVSDSVLAWTGFEEHELVGRPVWDTLARGPLGEALRAAHDDATGTAMGGVVAGPVATKGEQLHQTRWAQVPVEEGPGGRVVLTGLDTEPVDEDPAADDTAPADPTGTGDPEPSALDRVTRGLLETLSHELRTPVASVAGYAELLREGEGGQLTIMQRKFVGAIARNSERLRGLADQLLLIGGLESEPAQLRLDPVDLRDVVSAVRVSLAASGLERVEVSLEPGHDALPVVADRHRMGQVVEELVVNAAKFTLGSGQVTCSARLEDGHAVVEVVDDGVGVAGEDDPSSLFLPFYRSRAVRVRGVPGAGLGLTFAAAVVRGHGGEITAAPGVDGGSVFTVRLPLVRADDTQADETHEEPADEPGHHHFE